MGILNIEKKYANELLCGERVVSAILALSGLHVTQRELELLTYLTIKGSVSSINHRNDFLSTYNTTENSMNNAQGALKRKGLVTKLDGKVKSTLRLPQEFSNLGEKTVKIGFLCSNSKN